jgi:hypothetical protein
MERSLEPELRDLCFQVELGDEKWNEGSLAQAPLKCDLPDVFCIHNEGSHRPTGA